MTCGCLSRLDSRYVSINFLNTLRRCWLQFLSRTLLITVFARYQFIPSLTPALTSDWSSLAMLSTS